jgi:hypothetical protein
MSRVILKAISVGFLLIAGVGGIAAQEKPDDTRVTAPAKALPDETAARIQADESFELNIKERRITEANYQNSTAVTIGAEDFKNVRVQIGVALRAQSIDVLLRNVTGSVRFHGSLQRILDLVKARSPR